MNHRVLDVCCGGRMFWFDKSHPDALFLDIRTLARREIWRSKDGSEARSFGVEPDMQADFRALPLADDSFALVVFDPPHLVKRNGKTGWMQTKYGSLNPEWRDDLRKGFAECFRVLRQDGVLVFKWSEAEIPLSDVIELAPAAPLFAQRTARLSHWVTFMKCGQPRSAAVHGSGDAE